jgi:hypothetical protein
MLSPSSLSTAASRIFIHPRSPQLIPQNNLTLLFNPPKLTIGPTISAPILPHPSVLTQIPLVLFPQLQYSFTQTKPTLHPAVAEHRTGRGLSGSVSLHLNLAESKQTPRPSDSRAHAQLEVPLLLQRRSIWQLESQAGDVHTPLAQVLPKAQTLPHAPQCSLDVLRSWQPLLQRATSGPVQIGVDVDVGNVG